MVLSGLIGARLGFVLVHWNQPWTLNLVFSSHGSLYFAGILGGLVGLFVFARVKGSSVGTAFDLVTPSMVAMWAIGNIGCFMAGCCMGSPTTLPWGMRFLSESTPAELRDVPVHPAQLYSSAVELMLLVLLFTWRRHVEGELFLRAVIVLLTMHVVFAMGGISPGGFYTGSILYVCLDIAAVIVLITRRSKSQMLQRG